MSNGYPYPKYRADIDGLRAVAVLSVVAFHAFPEWFQGGFIGVDVFFVISGFLISSIIFKGLERGTFRFVDFYVRRIRRIFPALLLVLAASGVMGC
uniref:acyltransferase family protein n=1 Tax=Pseudomonas aeruginosa TaxID=287 RepID=UPI003CFB0F78